MGTELGTNRVQRIVNNNVSEMFLFLTEVSTRGLISGLFNSCIDYCDIGLSGFLLTALAHLYSANL